MSTRRYLALASLIAGIAAVCVVCIGLSGSGFWAAVSLAAEEGGGSGSSLPPLTVDRDAPLLLEEPEPEEEEPQIGPVADNQACFVCHANYQEEPFATWHAKANVGCVDCHGASHAHRNDEDNITPPDVMYPRDRIERCCAECHDEHDVPAREVIAMFLKRCLDRTGAEQIVCTDCHGEHRLPRRVVRWDKRTGELLSGQSATAPPAGEGQ